MIYDLVSFFCLTDKKSRDCIPTVPVVCSSGHVRSNTLQTMSHRFAMASLSRS